jgi:hypothetical protein
MSMPLYVAQPWWALGLLLPLVVFGVHYWRVSRLAQSYCSPALMSFMRLTPSHWRGLPWRWLAVWTLLVLVLCQPKWIDAGAQGQQRPIQWVALVDLSDSMQAQDVQPNRLQQARWLLEQSANQWQQGDKVGLVVFTASHHWLMPLTADKALWQAQLSLLEANLLPLRGSLLQQTVAALDAALPSDVGLLIIGDGGGIDASVQSKPLSRAALMVVFGKGYASLPESVVDGAGVDVGVPVSKVKRLAHDWGIDWVAGEQASPDVASWLETQRQHAIVDLPHASQQDVDLRAWFLLLALLVWLRFWRVERLRRVFYGLAVVTLFVAVVYQAVAVSDQADAAQASRAFQKAFRDALTEEEQVKALRGLATSLQAQSDWFSAAQSWRGLLAYQPDNAEAKAQLTIALSHLPKSVDWSGEGGKRPKGGREGVIDDWPDMPEQEETKDVLRETTVKNSLEIPPNPPLIKEGSSEEVVSVSQLAQAQKQARTDTAFLGEARALGAQQRSFYQRSFYQRLFEQEAGFAAAQSEPQSRDGVAPW